MPISVKGGGSTNVADVDANKNLLVSLPPTVTKAGHVSIAGESDPGSITLSGIGTRLIKPLSTSQDYRLRVGFDTRIFEVNFPGTSLNVNQWTNPFASMSNSVSGSVLTLNSTAVNTTGAYQIVSSWRTFPLGLNFTTSSEFQLRATSFQPNCTVEFGFGYVATTATPTDGAYFRYNGLTSTFQCVINNNGSEYFVVPDLSPTLDQFNHWSVVMSPDKADFWVDNSLYASIPVLPTWRSIQSSGSEPVFIRLYHNSSVGVPVRVMCSKVTVVVGDLILSKPISHIRAGNGLNAINYPAGYISTGSTANLVNSAPPATVVSGSLSNTTSGAYNTLGGDFNFAATNFNNDLDLIIFGWQNPAGLIGLNNTPGRNLYITGIRISTINFGAVTDGVVPYTIEWGLGVNSTAVSLATTDSDAVTKAARRIVLGTQNCPVSSVVGAPYSKDIDTQFATPYVVAPGDYLQVVQKVLTGLSTTGQTVRGTVLINGYWN